MKSLINITLTLIFLSNSLLSQNQIQSDSLKARFFGYHIVSMISLLANPEIYDGKRIQVSGYLHIKFEDVGIYLSKEDADYLRSENSFWARFSNNIKLESIDKNLPNALNYYDCKLVVIRGVFKRDDKGHLGMFAGSIQDIDFISENRQWYDGTKELWEDKLDGKGLIRKN